jgi:methionyl-tRNA formyltransferase
VQGLAPFPGAWFQANGERIKLLVAREEKVDSRFRGNDGLVLDDGLLVQCGDAALRPTLLQRAGKGAMSANELLRGFAIPKGTILT